jgi:two-component system sensor histidine kinase/response regulator
VVTANSAKRQPEILVIDDEVSVTELIAAILNKSGYVAHVANNGRDGLAKAAEVVPDLIITDITMPDMNGYELTERLKADARLAGITVIYLSGKSPAEDAGRAFATGALTYVRKPFTAQQLRDIVTLALQSAGTVRS